MRDWYVDCCPNLVSPSCAVSLPRFCVTMVLASKPWRMTFAMMALLVLPIAPDSPPATTDLATNSLVLASLVNASTAAASSFCSCCKLIWRSASTLACTAARSLSALAASWASLAAFACCIEAAADIAPSAMDIDTGSHIFLNPHELVEGLFPFSVFFV